MPLSGGSVAGTRLDKHLAEAGLSLSREKARSEIIAGWVKVNGETVREPSRQITGNESISVERPGGMFVSRGGEKLARALSFFSVRPTGRVCLDLGASTGGFTDCLLKNGAAKVYAVDVGYGQLDYSLRTDARVVVRERCNARNITPDMFAEPIALVVSDLSFISFAKVFPAVLRVAPGSEGIALIKPQSESGPDYNSKGIVRGKDRHHAVLDRVIGELTGEGLIPAGLTHSPLLGPKGNMEFLLHYHAGGEHAAAAVDVNAVLEAAYNCLLAENELTGGEAR
jgi:23S rRNA (cytidine1920-2'-O)/16S rRNA (cytidine1409-2'-O)-methyltransferase